MHTHFERKFRDYLGEKHHPREDEPRVYYKTEFDKSLASTYHDFLDNFLFDFGVVSISCDSPSLKSNSKYEPYVNFLKDNIFNEENGKKELSSIPLNKKASEELLADYLISRLNFISPSTFKSFQKAI